jgi:AraC family transcriptional regulator of adaptative response/methylated-DNA-[protein]-cysteine methyltransferase
MNYALFDTAIGTAALAANGRGVCALAFGDDAKALVEHLREAFPSETLALGDFPEWTAAIRRALAGDRAADVASIPLCFGGTAFQRGVWERLRAIPSGQTRTYGELARAMQMPGGAQAVAQACAANRIAYLVPCHRVVGASGDLRGFRWGRERKAKLLAVEAGASPVTLDLFG